MVDKLVMTTLESPSSTASIRVNVNVRCVWSVSYGVGAVECTCIGLDSFSIVDQSSSLIIDIVTMAQVRCDPLMHKHSVPANDVQCIDAVLIYLFVLFA